MHSLKPQERRQSARRRHYRTAKIQLGAGTSAHDCLVIDISDSGVRLYVEGLDVPDEFLLLFSGDGIAPESKYKVVWRVGHEVGAKFVDVVRQRGYAMRD